MASSIRFRAKGIGKKTEDGSWLFRNIDLEVDHGVLTITGPSGVGKSTLLKCINQTITMDEGQVWLEDKYDDPLRMLIRKSLFPEIRPLIAKYGHLPPILARSVTPDQWGIPTWRSKVMYIPQRAPIMEGTPLDFVEEVRRFSTHKKNKDSYDDPVQIALDWGIRPELWHNKWNSLSGGEMQRISLAIGCSFRPEILLLDEPTSALDEVSCSKVEETLGQMNCLWVTHNPGQAKRISSAGTLVIRGGDNNEHHSPSGVIVEEDGVHGHGHVTTETESSSNKAYTTTTTASSSSKNTRVNGTH